MLNLACARVAFVIALAAFLACSGGPTKAADYPQRNVHLIVPYPAGGPNDVIARLLGQKLGEIWNHQVVIENRAGGSGNIAVESVARAQPDGLTMVLPAMAYAVNPSLFSRVGYKFDDFAAVSIVTKGPVVLVVSP